MRSKSSSNSTAEKTDPYKKNVCVKEGTKLENDGGIFTYQKHEISIAKWLVIGGGRERLFVGPLVLFFM